MKHFIFLILFITFFLSKAYTQVFRAGFMIGPTITDIDGADMTDKDDDFHKLGISFGGLVNTKINKNNLIQMELAYIQKGSSQPPNQDNSNNYYTLAIHYVDVTFLIKHNIKLNVNKKDLTRFGIEGGITTGTPVFVNYSVLNYTQPKPEINKIDLNILLGLYYNFTSNLFLSLSYSNSIIRAIKHTTDIIVNPAYTFNKGNNLVFQITFGYVFKNGK